MNRHCNLKILQSSILHHIISSNDANLQTDQRCTRKQQGKLRNIQQLCWSYIAMHFIIVCTPFSQPFFHILLLHTTNPPCYATRRLEGRDYWIPVCIYFHMGARIQFTQTNEVTRLRNHLNIAHTLFFVLQTKNIVVFQAWYCIMAADQPVLVLFCLSKFTTETENMMNV